MSQQWQVYSLSLKQSIQWIPLPLISQVRLKGAVALFGLVTDGGAVVHVGQLLPLKPLRRP